MNLQHLRGWMSGEDCCVAGCGPSAEESGSSAFKATVFNVRWTVGCNRAAKWCYPDFACCVEPKRDKAAWKHVLDANPPYIFTHVDPMPHPRCIQISTKNIDEWEWTDDSDKPAGQLPRQPPDNHHYQKLRLGQSPFYAAACALWLGFETIGLIGVDLTPDRYGDRDVNTSNEMYGRLNALANSMGSKMINLNPESRLTSIPTGQWADVGCK